MIVMILTRRKTEISTLLQGISTAKIAGIATTTVRGARLTMVVDVNLAILEPAEMMTSTVVAARPHLLMMVAAMNANPSTLEVGEMKMTLAAVVRQVLGLRAAHMDTKLTILGPAELGMNMVIVGMELADMGVKSKSQQSVRVMTTMVVVSMAARMAERAVDIVQTKITHGKPLAALGIPTEAILIELMDPTMVVLVVGSADTEKLMTKPKAVMGAPMLGTAD